MNLLLISYSLLLIIIPTKSLNQFTSYLTLCNCSHSMLCNTLLTHRTRSILFKEPWIQTTHMKYMLTGKYLHYIVIWMVTDATNPKNNSEKLDTIEPDILRIVLIEDIYKSSTSIVLTFCIRCDIDVQYIGCFHHRKKTFATEFGNVNNRNHNLHS